VTAAGGTYFGFPIRFPVEGIDCLQEAKDENNMVNTTGSANNGKRRKIAFSVCIMIVLVGAVSVYLYREYLKTHITTDDAFITGRIHVIAAKIPGTVLKLHVQDNQFVHLGDLLLEIDERDYALGVTQAHAAVESEKAKLAEILAQQDVARKHLAELRFNLESTGADLKLQEAQFRQAGADLRRAENLFAKNVMPEEQVEKARTTYDITAARLESAGKQVKRAQGAVETQQAVILQCESALKSQQSSLIKQQEFLKAQELKMSYTRLFAPASGYITKRSIEAGNQIQAGQSLMAVVPLDDIWITANYKETQLAGVKPGQAVKIKVDTFPGRVFSGMVDSIMAGTGSVFSLFPPENATGNYVKIVQRIPVKIVLDKETDPEHVLRIGMSTVPTILVED